MIKNKLTLTTVYKLSGKAKGQREKALLGKFIYRQKYEINQITVYNFLQIHFICFLLKYFIYKSGKVKGIKKTNVLLQSYLNNCI